MRTPASGMPWAHALLRPCLSVGRQSADDKHAIVEDTMHRSRLGTILIDCEAPDIERAARFWGAALGAEERALEDPGDANYRLLLTSTDQPKVLVQKVDHPSRVHLDIETDDIEAEVRRLESLGARRVAFVKRWYVMQAPTGQRFCVVRPQRPDFDENAKVWD